MLLGIWVAFFPARNRAGQAEFAPHVRDLLRRLKPLPLELEAGELLLLSTATLHSSGRNTTGRPRRAFSLCLMDGATRHVGEHNAPFLARGKAAMTDSVWGCRAVAARGAGAGDGAVGFRGRQRGGGPWDRPGRAA